MWHQALLFLAMLAGVFAGTGVLFLLITLRVRISLSKAASHE